MSSRLRAHFSWPGPPTSASTATGPGHQVNDERMFQRVLARGTLGLGEAYMNGWWDCDQLGNSSAAQTPTSCAT
jgi:hypothetical protein